MTATQPPHTEALPADTRLRKPQKPMPLGTIDCHAHIFDRFDVYPLAPSAQYRPQLSTREAWFALHDALGVARGVQVQGSPYGFDNSITEDFVREHPSRLRAVGAIALDVSDATLKRLSEAGFVAARMMDQFATGLTTKDLDAIAARVAPFGWHLEINIAKSEDWVALEPKLMNCPVPIGFDHMGRTRGGEGINAPGFQVIRRVLDRRPDCFTKISSWYRLSDVGPPSFADMKSFAQTLLRNNPDQCVWGTNWPHPSISSNMPNDIDLVDQLEEWMPSEEVREKLFVRNPERIYQFQNIPAAPGSAVAPFDA